MKEAPFALWILAGLVALGLFLAFILAVRRRGDKKYGLAFFKSIQFGLVMIGAIFLASMAVLVHVVPKMDVVNYDIAKATSILTVIAALALNIRKSNVPFGILYTLAQVLAAYSFILAFLGVTVLKKIDD